MARKNGKVIGIVAGVVFLLICGAFLFEFLQLVKIDEEEKELNPRVLTLLQEKERIQIELANVEAILSEKDAEIAELNACDDLLANARQEYYGVCKQLEDAVLEGRADFKIAYLTFDDGPYVDMTPQFLQVLKDRDILATFFQIGKPDEKYDALYHQVYEAGHTIANHTYSHKMKDGIYLSVENFINDVIQNRDFIQDKLGITTNILRFPGGSGSALGLKPEIVRQLKELGYGYVDWTAATGDGIEVASPEEYYENVLGRYNWGGDLQVVLMHDYSQSSLTCLPWVIDAFAGQGYIFLPLFYESSVVIKE